MTKIKNAILSIPKVGEFYRIMKFEYASHFKFNAPNLLDVDFSKPIIWFVDSPTYGNGGDQAIAYATELFIKDNFSEYGFIEFTDMQYPYYMRWMRNKVKKTDIIILQGGGNLGNLYPYFEHVRRRVISNFKDIRTIIMPQSVYFTDDFSGKRALKRTRSIYQKNGNLTVACRERRSYELLRSKMPALDVISCPDMVFYLNGKFPTCERQKDMVCLLMRGDDQEKTISNNTVDEAIKKYCKNKKIMRTDTNVKKLFRLNERRGGGGAETTSDFRMFSCFDGSASWTNFQLYYPHALYFFS